MKTIPSPADLALPAAAPMTTVRWRIFLILLLLTAINYIDRASLSVALPLIAPEFNLTPAMEGLMLSAFFWSYALMQIPGGMLLDRFHTRGIIGAATVAWGLFQALGAASHNWLVLLLTRIGLGVAESPIMPAGAKLNGAWLTPNERGRGAVLVDGGAPLGSALGAILISGLIAWLGSWRLAFVVAGIGTVLAGILAWKYIRNHPSEHPGQRGRTAPHHRRQRQRPRSGSQGQPAAARAAQGPFDLCHVRRLQLHPGGVLRPADLDAELPAQGPRPEHLGHGRGDLPDLHVRVCRRTDRRLDR